MLSMKLDKDKSNEEKLQAVSDAHGARPAAYGRMERYPLLSFAGRYAVVADDLQLVVERIYPQGHEYRIALHSIRRRLHRLRLVGLEPQTPRRLQRRTQILKTLRRSLDQRSSSSVTNSRYWGTSSVPNLNVTGSVAPPVCTARSYAAL